jgi:hypothetical protein
MKPFFFFLFGFLICGFIFWTTSQHSESNFNGVTLSSDVADRNKKVEVQAQKIDIKKFSEKTQ